MFVDGVWVDVCEITNEPEVEGDDYRAFETTWVFEFDTITAQKIRILQPKACGAHDKYGDAVRPGIMWVSEVEIYKEAKIYE
mgnify:FL=1